MITSNIIQRTFHIRRGESTGTAFAIDRESKQYLVTARHVIRGIESDSTIQIFHEEQWKSLNVNVVGVGTDTADIAVLSCPIQLSPPHPLEPTMTGLVYGQSVYFLGFPFGWDSGQEELNRGLPLPFVKAGILSAIPPKDPVEKIYIDAHGNEGFSGGPVVFVPNGQHTSTNAEFRVAGIVVNYPIPRIQPVVTPQDTQVLDQNNNPIGIWENPGFVVAIGIQHATDLIDTNPIGFKLTNH